MRSALQAPHEPRRERDARHERQRERDEGGGHERAPDHRLDPTEAVERAPQVEHEARAAGREWNGGLRLRPARFPPYPRDRAALAQRSRHLREVIVSVEVRPGQHSRGAVEHEHLAAGLAPEGVIGALELRRPCAQLLAAQVLEG